MSKAKEYDVLKNLGWDLRQVLIPTDRPLRADADGDLLVMDKNWVDVCTIQACHIPAYVAAGFLRERRHRYFVRKDNRYPAAWHFGLDGASIEALDNNGVRPCNTVLIDAMPGRFYESDEGVWEAMANAQTVKPDPEPEKAATTLIQCKVQEDTQGHLIIFYQGIEAAKIYLGVNSLINAGPSISARFVGALYGTDDALHTQWPKWTDDSGTIWDMTTVRVAEHGVRRRVWPAELLFAAEGSLTHGRDHNKDVPIRGQHPVSARGQRQDL